MSEPLSQDTVGRHLVDRGIVDDDTYLQVRPLTGGVSSVVLDVRTPDRRLIVKQPLERFDVPDEWVVKRERVLVEAEALRLAARILPGAVPSVVHVDADEFVLVMDGAPEGWRSWKEELLEGVTSVDVATQAGRALAAWHGATRSFIDRFDDPEIFGQQRADPYYRTTMKRRPELAAAMGGLLDRMLATHECLVHGDYSPKNILAGEDGLWIIDWEITHAGDPAFDIAFMTSHLMLKAIHRRADAALYEACAQAFWSAYGSVTDPSYVLAHVGCLMVARVDGKSPAEYLTERQRETARSVGSRLVTDPPGSVPDAWLRLSG